MLDPRMRIVSGDRVPLGGQGDPAATDVIGLLFPAVVIRLFAMACAAATASKLAQGHIAAAAWPAVLAIAIGAFFARYLRDFLPQRAWLEGSVLSVARGQAVRQCDLASAAVIRLRSTVPPMVRGHSGFPVLFVRQGDALRPVRLTMRGPDLRDLPVNDLRMLARIIDGRPGPADAKTQKVVQRLRATADHRTRHHSPRWTGAFGPTHTAPGTRRVAVVATRSLARPAADALLAWRRSRLPSAAAR